MYEVLVVDDHPVVRHGIVHILSSAPDIAVRAEAEAAYPALKLIESHRFDAVLLDIALPDMNGVEALRLIKKTRPTLPVLILSIYKEELYALRAIKEGAAGYLTKDSASSELIEAVRKICTGGRYITSALADRLAVAIAAPEHQPLHARLSLRELEVLRRIGHGTSVKGISADMHLSPKTISTYRTRILEKMRMKTTEDLVRYAAANDLSN